MFSTTNVWEKWNMEKWKAWRTTRRNYRRILQIVCISSRFRVLRLLSWEFERLKSSEDTLLYLYVILNMLKSADLHETLLTPVICHKHVRCHDGVTLYFSMKFPSVAPKKTRNGHFSIYQQISAHSKWKQQKKKRRNSRLSARKHWESEIIIATSLRYYYK